MSNVEERYARATGSSHLEVKRHEEAPGDADTIIAAGMSEPLGTLLARLKAEWDAGAGEAGLYRKAQTEWRRLSAESTVQARKCTEAIEQGKKALATADKPEKAAIINRQIEAAQKGVKHHESEALRFLREADRESATSRALILMGLRSLEPARLALVAYALSHARDKAFPDRAAAPRAELRALTQKLGQDLTPDDRAATVAAHLAKVREVSNAAAAHHQRIVAVVGKVLEAWLDKLCEPCAGRGFSGGVGAPVVLCSACKGTKTRRLGPLSDTPGEHQYGLWLLNVIEIKIAGSMGQMARKTRRA